MSSTCHLLDQWRTLIGLFATLPLENHKFKYTIKIATWYNVIIFICWDSSTHYPGLRLLTPNFLHYYLHYLQYGRLYIGFYYTSTVLNVVSTVHFQMGCVKKLPTNAHKLFNSLFLKYPYTYFGGLNHHLQGVVEINMHRLIVITYMVTFIYVEYEWAGIAHFVQYVKLL
jgi:hypothetical protein